QPKQVPLHASPGIGADLVSRAQVGISRYYNEGQVAESFERPTVLSRSGEDRPLVVLRLKDTSIAGEASLQRAYFFDSIFTPSATAGQPKGCRPLQPSNRKLVTERERQRLVWMRPIHQDKSYDLFPVAPGKSDNIECARRVTYEHEGRFFSRALQ